MIDPAGKAVLPAPPANARHSEDDPAWKAAQALEQNFLSEMLKSAGLGAMKGSFAGGIGEDQFASYLRNEQAAEMVRAGGIGLAERLFQAMKAEQHGN